MSSPFQIRAGAFFFFFLLYKKKEKKKRFLFLFFFKGSSIKRQAAKEYICYFRDVKIFILVFHKVCYRKMRVL